jgi:CspA family cold shock protein
VARLVSLTAVALIRTIASVEAPGCGVAVTRIQPGGWVPKGKVKWFNETSGFGFIEQESDRDVLVHFSAIQTDGFMTLVEGDEVEFEVSTGKDGLHASKVVRL